jgi:hypothetical protein
MVIRDCDKDGRVPRQGQHYGPREELLVGDQNRGPLAVDLGDARTVEVEMSSRGFKWIPHGDWNWDALSDDASFSTANNDGIIVGKFDCWWRSIRTADWEKLRCFAAKRCEIGREEITLYRNLGSGRW